ncbi:uncharacterized protein PFL1_06046 [Pseudozyma flocculosa PF-1]|uniref:Related to DUF1680 domain protein n=2 Tax=Pseudozyma flocculosa TaxID=84751 RepID=A0A5C3F6E8_9BASI|nr:uncharacterized protein PFL1_06046 [Pseudozyma flocculosa PF-1]EPQ26398.1 hypothetical protein PFL1_06046 [Pseudozyma flocculosa PF-1]SPO39009.1 related to DUF1680 domain protein [Pseudozyma flocculosa]
MAGCYPQEKFRSAQLEPDSFWDRWQRAACHSTIPVQLDLLKRTGRYDAFNLKHIPYYDQEPTIWPVPDHLFWESDVAKWVEGVCYHLQSRKDADQGLRQHVDYLVDLIVSAQQPDGYLNIHFVVVEPEKRWSNLRDLHELYNAGHLIEAALAHHQLTGSSKLIDAMLRFVSYCCTIFPQKLAGYPGHPEIELALLRLYHRTRRPQCLELAAYFLTERGRDGGQFYKDEQARRGEHKHTIPGMMPKPYSFWYMQAHQPIAEQQTIEGHSVRAMYLLTAVADVTATPEAVSRVGGQDQLDALKAATSRLWKSMVHTKMYVTGGIGSIKQWEGFGLPHSLPNSTDEGGCYTETCAGIGLLMLADRMLHASLDGRVADVAERVLYNSSITTGMSEDGRAFTYVNQLASSAEEPCRRFEWFECACCPPNVMRTFGCLQGYFFGSLVDRPLDLAIHQLFAGSVVHEGTKVSLRTAYPDDGHVEIDVETLPAGATVWVRVPGWAKGHTLSSADGDARSSELTSGYLSITAPGRYTLEIQLEPRILVSHPDTGAARVTLAYGPLIYCIEDVDNGWVDALPPAEQHFKHTSVSLADLRKAEKVSVDGHTAFRAPRAGYTLDVDDDAAYASAFELDQRPSYREAEGEGHDLVLIPYYWRCNRKSTKGRMRTSLLLKQC